MGDRQSKTDAAAGARRNVSSAGADGKTLGFSTLAVHGGEPRPKLANALATVFESHEPLHAGLQRYVDVFTAATRQHTANKLGLTECLESDV